FFSLSHLPHSVERRTTLCWKSPRRIACSEAMDCAECWSRGNPITARICALRNVVRFHDGTAIYRLLRRRSVPNYLPASAQKSEQERPYGLLQSHRAAAKL